MARIVDFKNRWFKLDNAAKIFPGQNSRTWSNIFRLCVVLKEPVNPEILGEALKQTLVRFPWMKVRLKNGFFWHYFSPNTSDAPPIMSDVNNPCHRVNFKENEGFLFRVYYFGNRISVDTFHSLCDGYGNAVFTYSMVAQYYRLLGENIPFGEYVLDLKSMPDETEYEDSFLKNATSKAKYDRKDKFVYHPDGTKLPPHTVNITSGIISFSELHRITKEKSVTITEYLAAVLLMIHIEKQKSERRVQKEVCIQVPINLRKMFGSKTLRNFTVCLRTKIDPNRGEYSFNDILRQVSLQLRLNNNKNDMNMLITANTAIERNKILRLMPLAVKDLGIKISFLITGEETTTSLLSNLGAVHLPEELLEHIDHSFLMPGPGIKNPARVGVATVGDAMAVTFCSMYSETDIEREFFRFLVKQGIHVKIESNR